ncbi:FLYWCH zinc finger domain-containing protein [Phthorimaea operculella]|nr:FLYWCH zinc finger domain-containing protein [Phthorimaea operculella]
MHKLAVILLAKSRYTGKHIIMYNDYTYYCKKQCKKSKLFDWYCSTHNYKGCNAKLKLSENFAVMGETSEHTHPPAKYCIHDGQYIKI